MQIFEKLKQAKLRKTTIQISYSILQFVFIIAIVIWEFREK